MCVLVRTVQNNNSKVGGELVRKRRKIPVEASVQEFFYSGFIYKGAACTAQIFFFMRLRNTSINDIDDI